jgi:hypothetical protein
MTEIGFAYIHMIGFGIICIWGIIASIVEKEKGSYSFRPFMALTLWSIVGSIVYWILKLTTF